MSIDLQAKQQLAKLLAKPASVTQADAALLTTLVETYPYYQPLHLLLAKAKSAGNNEQQLLATTALYNGGSLLHKMLNYAENFSERPIKLIYSNKKKLEVNNLVSSQLAEKSIYLAVAQEDDEVFEEINEVNSIPQHSTENTEEENPALAEEENTDDEVFEEINEISSVPRHLTENIEDENPAPAEEENKDDEVFEEINEVNSIPQHSTENTETENPAPTEEENNDDEVFEEINEVNSVPQHSTENTETENPAPTVEENNDDEVFEEINEVNSVPQHSTENKEEENPAPAEEGNNDEEVFEEINEVNSVPQHSTENKEEENPATAEEENNDDEVFEEITETNSIAEQPFTTSTIAENAHEVLPDELAIGNIVATDFFAFEQNFSSEKGANPSNTVPVTFSRPEEYNADAEKQTVSKYDDDKLPFTFLWWLAKTRKEHEQIFQPYVTAKKQSPVANGGELQHQYVEHIFHLQTPFNIVDEANKLGDQSIFHRGGNIIDSFIKNDPQISVPKADQINNENKAKKSAEDNYDLVSETLASIYIEQMLYHKAIDTYEKLSLKFPEKSRYFADLIQSLEKKI